MRLTLNRHLMNAEELAQEGYAEKTMGFHLA